MKNGFTYSEWYQMPVSKRQRFLNLAQEKQKQMEREYQKIKDRQNS